MFFTKTKIGFTKIQEKSVSSNFCNSVSIFTFISNREAQRSTISLLKVAIQALFTPQLIEERFISMKLLIKAKVWNASPEVEFKPPILYFRVRIRL